MGKKVLVCDEVLGYEAGYSIAADASGNVYSAGIYSGTVDFDPGSGTFNLGSVGGGFTQKLDNLGNFLWAKCYDGGGATSSMALDASGNIYSTEVSVEQ